MGDNPSHFLFLEVPDFKKDAMYMKVIRRKLGLNLIELILEIWLSLNDFVNALCFKMPLFVLLWKFGDSSRVGSISNNTFNCIQFAIVLASPV